MSTIITNEWINSKDLVDNGEVLISSLNKELRNVAAKIKDVEAGYADLMRAANLTEEEQEQAKFKSQEVIAALASSIQTFTIKLGETAQSIDSVYSPAIVSLLSDYVPAPNETTEVTDPNFVPPLLEPEEDPA